MGFSLEQGSYVSALANKVGVVGVHDHVSEKIVGNVELSGKIS